MDDPAHAPHRVGKVFGLQELRRRKEEKKEEGINPVKEILLSFQGRVQSLTLKCRRVRRETS